MCLGLELWQPEFDAEHQESVCSTAKQKIEAQRHPIEGEGHISETAKPTGAGLSYAKGLLLLATGGGNNDECHTGKREGGRLGNTSTFTQIGQGIRPKSIWVHLRSQETRCRSIEPQPLLAFPLLLHDEIIDMSGIARSSSYSGLPLITVASLIPENFVISDKSRSWLLSTSVNSTEKPERARKDTDEMASSLHDEAEAWPKATASSMATKGERSLLFTRFPINSISLWSATIGSAQQN